MYIYNTCMQTFINIHAHMQMNMYIVVHYGIFMCSDTLNTTIANAISRDVKILKTTF